MDSLTQAALGALCGEIILSRQLGWRGVALGAFFGTLPDLDIIAYYWLDAGEQLRWHRGISHSLLIIPIAAVIFGWLLSQGTRGEKLLFKRAFWFVAITWGTHILIDCFNTYGTQVLEPFSDHRFSLNCMFIIDPFFTVPMLIGLLLCLTIFRKQWKWRKGVQWVTVVCICSYFVAALSFKLVAERQIRDRFNSWGVTPTALMTAPTPMNIFCWRGVARDDEKYYITYWSLFDEGEREDPVVEFSKGHHLEKDFKESEDFQTIKWFTKGWRKTYQNPEEPNSIYIATLMMGEMRVKEEDKTVFKPPFIWKITKTDSGFLLERPHKMSKDVWSKLDEAGEALSILSERVKGGQENWMQGEWIWDRIEK